MIYSKSLLPLHKHPQTIRYKDHLVIQIIANSLHINPNSIYLSDLNQIEKYDHPSSMIIGY